MKLVEKIDEVELPEYVTKTMFDCFEQQIFTICQFYRNEIWKLFLKQEFKANDTIGLRLNNAYTFKPHVRLCAKDIYNISIEPFTDSNENIQSNSGLTLIEITSSAYKYTADIEKEGSHNCIICGEKNDSYVINDNYYNVKSELFDKESIDRGITLKYSVIVGAYNEDDIADELISFFSVNLYDEYKKIQNSLSVEYDYANELIDYFTTLYRCCNKIAVVIRNIDRTEDAAFLEACADIIDKHVLNIQNSVYGIVKSVLRGNEINYLSMIERMSKHDKDMLIIQNVIDEISNILNEKESVIDKVKNQIKQYENDMDEIESININDSVYDVHDKLTILFLLNFFEENNSNICIEYDEIAGMDKYIEFLVLVYKKILETSM